MWTADTTTWPNVGLDKTAWFWSVLASNSNQGAPETTFDNEHQVHEIQVTYTYAPEVIETLTAEDKLVPEELLVWMLCAAVLS